MDETRVRCEGAHPVPTGSDSTEGAFPGEAFPRHAKLFHSGTRLRGPSRVNAADHEVPREYRLGELYAVFSRAGFPKHEDVRVLAHRSRNEISPD
jgi:hypothetical protein